MMKKLFVLLLILSFGFFAFNFTKSQDFSAVQGVFVTAPCAKPILYSIGEVDSRFGKSREQLISEVKKSAQIWNDVYETPIFEYSETASLDINFVFDKRQGLQNEIVDLEDKLSDQKGDLSAQVANYQKQVNALDAKKEKLDSDIAYWNSRGGAPEEEQIKEALPSLLFNSSKFLSQVINNTSLCANCI